MNASDMVENLIMQKAEEIKAVRLCNRILFVDTDALTTKFYSQFLLTDASEVQACNNLADAITYFSRFDLVFFLEPTADFVQDGTRNEEIAKNRKKYSEQLKQLFIDLKIDLALLNGSYLDRFNTAKMEIEKRLGIKTAW